MTDDLILPEFAPADLDSLRASLDAHETPAPDAEVIQPPKRKRGRPRKSPLPTTEEVRSEPSFTSRVTSIADKVESKSYTVDQKELSDRLSTFFEGMTGLPAIALGKPYIEMTAKEAQNIAIPTAHYLERIAPESAIAAAFIEQYDIFAIAVGLMAYFMRVVSARQEEVRNAPASSVAGNGNTRQGSLVSRITEHQESRNGREQGESHLAEQRDGTSEQFVTSGTIVPAI